MAGSPQSGVMRTGNNTQMSSQRGDYPAKELNDEDGFCAA